MERKLQQKGSPVWKINFLSGMHKAQENYPPRRLIIRLQMRWNGGD
jgi:hypothetical protein